MPELVRDVVVPKLAGFAEFVYDPCVTTEVMTQFSLFSLRTALILRLLTILSSLASHYLWLFSLPLFFAAHTRTYPFQLFSHVCQTKAMVEHVRRVFQDFQVARDCDKAKQLSSAVHARLSRAAGELPLWSNSSTADSMQTTAEGRYCILFVREYWMKVDLYAHVHHT